MLFKEDSDDFKDNDKLQQENERLTKDLDACNSELAFAKQELNVLLKWQRVVKELYPEINKEVWLRNTRESSISKFKSLIEYY